MIHGASADRNALLCLSTFLAFTGFAGLSCAASPPIEAPPGLRAAIAKHDNEQAEIRHRLYGSPLEVADPSSYEFRYALVDLNGDGIVDAIVYFTQKQYCGSGGCSMEIYRGTKTGFVFLSGTLRVSPPILVLAASAHGWKSLAVRLREGGSGVLNFNGRRYPLSPPDGHPAPASELRGAVAVIN
jgi:hypothetical protein